MTTTTNQPTAENPVSTDAGCSSIHICLACFVDLTGHAAVLGCLCRECGIVFIKTGALPKERLIDGWVSALEVMPSEDCDDIELRWSEVGTAKGGVPTHWRFKR